MKKINKVLLALSSLISGFLFIRFFMPRWFGVLIYNVTGESLNHNLGESWIVYLFWAIVLTLTIVELIANKNKRKISLVFIIAVIAQILFLPLMANIEFFGNIYFIFTSIVNVSLCAFAVRELASAIKESKIFKES